MSISATLAPKTTSNGSFGPYEKLVAHAEPISLDTCQVLVIGLEDLIAIKRHINRPKDQAALQQLEGLKRLREAGGEASQ